MPDAVATPERTKGLRGLKDKNVLITGGSSGIGQAIAVRFAEYGANVAINYLTQTGEAAAELGGIDVLVNNAGIQISRPSEELSSEDFDKVLAVNLRGAFLCAREAIKHFLANGEQLGNFPQAYSHIGLITAAYEIDRAKEALS